MNESQSLSPSTLLTHFAKPLASLVPPVRFELYEKLARDMVGGVVERRREGRSFAILSAMDSDSLATYLVMRELYPKTSICVVYPRIRNEIDRQRESRTDQFIKKYHLKKVNLAEHIDNSCNQLPLDTFYEFWVDDVLRSFHASLGINNTNMTWQRGGLFFNNALGTLLNNYWDIVANVRRGILIGTLSGTSLLLGDYYYFAVDGECYPLSPLLRTDIGRILREQFGVPERLRNVSPWQQKVRTNGQPLNNLFWSSLPRMNRDVDVVLLPRNFYRIADPVLFLLFSGASLSEVKEKIISQLYQYERDQGESLNHTQVQMIGEMCEVVDYLKTKARGKFEIHRSKFLELMINRFT